MASNQVSENFQLEKSHWKINYIVTTTAVCVWYTWPRHIGLSRVSRQTSLGLGSMSRYSAQILICITNRVRIYTGYSCGVHSLCYMSFPQWSIQSHVLILLPRCIKMYKVFCVFYDVRAIKRLISVKLYLVFLRPAKQKPQSCRFPVK